jgi:uncharacterized protein (TIGR04255 family)
MLIEKRIMCDSEEKRCISLASHGPLAEPTATEVLFELRFNSSRHITTYADALRRRVEAKYPKDEKLDSISLGLKIENGPEGPRMEAFDQNSFEGLDVVTRRFSNPQTQTLMQIGPSMVTFNTTRYEGFDAFVSEMMDVLQIHNEYACVESYRRFGLRYINHIPLSEAYPNDVFSWIVPLPPDISPSKPLVSNAQEIVTQVEDSRQRLVAAYPQVDQKNNLVSLLDIDFFLEFASPEAPQQSRLNAWVNQAHESIWETYVQALKPTFLDRKKYGPAVR